MSVLLPSLLLLLLIHSNCATGAHSPSPDILAQYRLTNSSKFTHLRYDSRRHLLYAGATNRLLQLSKSLQVLKEAQTGPKLDSPSCHASGCGSLGDDVDAVETSNFNKLLLIDAAGDSLIACGSIHQGSCEIYALSKFPDSSRNVELPVAANDENSTTFGFIGPSKYLTWKTEDVLYVGTTFTDVGDYRHDVPAISSRKLDDLQIAEYSIQQSLVQIDVKYRDHFLVNYVYGFNTSDYAYFLVVQKKSHLAEEAGYETRLARICVSDTNYDSYTEITITCLDEEKRDYNILRDAKITPAGHKLAQQMDIKKDDMVLVAVFSPSREISNEPKNQSAMCVFSLKHINEVFMENIHMCFNGSVKDRNMGYISGTILDGKCPQSGSIGNVFNFCGVGLRISGVSPIVSESLFTFRNESVTAVSVTLAGSYTLAFLGTNNGDVLKVLLSGPLPGEYERVTVDKGNTILPDTLLSPKQDFLYVLSTKSVSKMQIEHCGTYTNCSSCLDSRDPFCGWCSLEKRCTVRSACQRDTSASRWLSLGTGQQCIDFEMVLPDRIPIHQMSTVQLIIRTLPELPFNSKYKCVFGTSNPIDANVTDNGLVCATPPIKSRPTIEAGKDHVSVPLSVRSSETNKDFVSRSFSFYDCSRHDSCRKCVQSQWACSWCLYDNKCVHNVSSCRNSGGHISDESYCPHFKYNAAPILLPNKVPKEIRLEVENLPRPQSAHTGFLCSVHIEGAHMVLPARVESNKFIVCERTPYSYEAGSNEYEAKVSVNWNRNHYIDTTSITLYKCDILGSHREHADCSLCVTRDAKYQCSWCGSHCVYNETCAHGTMTECPRPRIDMIKPLSGPVEGGTLITIEGSNLGIREEDVRGRIRVGDVPCELVNYEISVKIECRTGAVTREMSAPVKVANEAGYTESAVMFQYRDIKLEGLHPTMGPRSGGTKLSIIGHYLNIGSSITAYLDNYPCQVNVSQASSGRLTCVTSGSESPEHIKTLTLAIDGANRTLTCIRNRFIYDDCSVYNYTVDPKILQIKPLKSFVSGGRMITVHGSNLDSIQKPEIEVSIDEVSVNKSTCSVLNANQMECPSPAVNAKFFEYMNDKSKLENIKKNTVPIDALTTAGYTASGEVAALKIREMQIAFQISFVMDSVASVKDLNKHFNGLRSSLLYVEDPVFFAFQGGIKSYKGDTLVIEGENLNVASDESDVNVTIGMMPCNVTSLAMSQLVCTPPKVQPEATDENGVEMNLGLPLVVVRVGRSLRYPIGHLKYDLQKSLSSTQALFFIIVVISLAVVVILTVVLILYRRKSTQAEREYRRIQIQMDTLESNVRLECKQAFAELQTDMTDLAADIENSGIPTLDHVNYIMKVFFPGVTDHPILNAPKMRNNVPRTNYDQAMLQFEQLINNKSFLLTFIETLEQQKSFNIRDKVNVASLLMIVLMNKMEYSTDILKSLLLRLVDKSIMTKHPQLMLRRTESVVEKMLTNYMAICMYDYLKEYAGSSLFLLFKAIKHQIEKGLVDTVTNDARYSLSEERLLREQIDHSFVTLHILQDDLDEKIQCKVLDCDSISQVKAKILDALFKNTPFSMRPAVQDVDLEWRHGRGGHLTLQDEDLTTKTINGWKRLNTLAHYGVKESAVMSLIAKQNDAYMGYNKQIYPNWHYINNTQSHIIISNADMDPSLQLHTLPAGHGGHHGGQLRIYHLVKPHIDDHHHFRTMGPSTERTHKAIPEIFLTRLLATKGTIQKFVDDFFATILTVNDELPLAVKWLFDLLDDAARRYGIQDHEVVHAWKSNSFPLRFWVNFIKNPDFIFDINKTVTVDASLSVIAQTFMDSCSTNEHRLGKDSPSNKLLFAKDIPQYREMVSRFYGEIAQLPQISDQEMCTAMQQLSVRQNEEFDTMVALKELYIYVTKYRDQILDALDMDINCKKLHLSHKLENVACTLEGVFRPKKRDKRGEAQIVEESPQIAASPSLLVAAAAAAAATTIVTRNPSQSLKAAKPRHHKSTSMTSSSATFNKMLTDHMLSNLQEAKKFPFNQSLLATAKSYADLTGDFAENASKNQIKSERLSPANLKTEIELETYQPSSYLRSPIQTPTPPTSPRPNESSSFVPARPADGEDAKPNHFIGDNVDSASFLPPPPNHFNARNYSDIMRSLAAKYNSCSNEILPPSGTFDSRGSSQAKALPESSYSNSNQLNPNTTNPALTGLLTGLRLSQAAIFPPFMDMSSTQTLLTLAKVAKEAEVHRAKSGAKPNSDQGALSRQIGQLLSLSSNTSSSSRSKNKNGETDLTHSPLDLSSSPVSKRIKLSSDSPIGDGASSTKSTSSGKLSPKTRPVCEREAASREVNAWTLDQVADFVGSIDICAEYAQNFREQQIDGTGLPLLTEEHLTGSLGMKLGPALKLRSLLTKRLSVACSCPSCSLTLAFGPSNSDESSTLLRAELS